MDSRINLTFNLSWQSEVLLKMLENYFECHILDSYETTTTIEDLDDLEIETFPLYNCRERGICLVIDAYRPGPSLLIFFSENRNSDALFVQWQEVEEGFMNGPTIGNFSEESYRQREYFDYDNFVKVAGFICEKIGTFHKERMEKAA